MLYAPLIFFFFYSFSLKIPRVYAFIIFKIFFLFLNYFPFGARRLRRLVDRYDLQFHYGIIFHTIILLYVHVYINMCVHSVYVSNIFLLSLNNVRNVTIISISIKIVVNSASMTNHRRISAILDSQKKKKKNIIINPSSDREIYFGRAYKMYKNGLSFPL